MRWLYLRPPTNIAGFSILEECRFVDLERDLERNPFGERFLIAFTRRNVVVVGFPHFFFGFAPQSRVEENIPLRVHRTSGTCLQRVHSGVFHVKNFLGTRLEKTSLGRCRRTCKKYWVSQLGWIRSAILSAASLTPIHWGFFKPCMYSAHVLWASAVID